MLALARREAIPQAEKTADDLAEALGVVRGSVISALEFPLTDFRFGPPGLGIKTCGSQFRDPFALQPFDSESEIEVSVGLQVTYALESQ